MKRLNILLFSISLLVVITANSQQKLDTVKPKEKYGIRLGIDLSKPIISYLNSETKGLEMIGDIRILKNYYAAFEFGFEEKTTIEDYLNFTTNGSYLKIGANYNAYENWQGMSNEIYIGARYGLSFFDQTLNSYTPNIKGTYFTPNLVEPNTEFNDLTAQWAELVFGLKVETLKNLYLGASVSFKKIINSKEPSNFKNLHIPGFNRVFVNDSGVGFNYSLSYLIPIIKRKN